MAVLSGGGFSVTVLPGETVDYQVVGRLTDSLNEGLAGFRFDLEFDGGDLPQADAPTGGNMLNFTNPLGWSNPAGFGGTLKDGKLQAKSLQSRSGPMASCRTLFGPATIGWFCRWRTSSRVSRLPH